MNDLYNSNTTYTGLTAEEIIAKDQEMFQDWRQELRATTEYNNTQCNAHVRVYEDRLIDA